eukprot:Skav213467  [mRNA]  locus=scaffold3211:150312:154826:+ [translate_table: standard]
MSPSQRLPADEVVLTGWPTVPIEEAQFLRYEVQLKDHPVQGWSMTGRGPADPSPVPRCRSHSAFSTAWTLQGDPLSPRPHPDSSEHRRFQWKHVSRQQRAVSLDKA